MPVVTYEYQLAYAHDPDGNRFPRLSFQIARVDQPAVSLDVHAYLDSGAQRSLVSGRIGAALGIDILSGPKLVLQTTLGNRLEVTVHPVRLVHPDLGSFTLEVGFSSTDIHRNLLGRDFFDLAQIGFRERFLTLYVTPSP
jgi:Aspartyl protease